MLEHMMNVGAHLGHRSSELSAEASDSEFGYFTWTENGVTLALSMSRDALREFARQATAVLSALDYFNDLEENDEKTGDFQIRTGEAGQHRTPGEVATAIRQNLAAHATATGDTEKE